MTVVLKVGGDFEYNYFQHYRSYTGGNNVGFFTTFADQTATRADNK